MSLTYEGTNAIARVENTETGTSRYIYLFDKKKHRDECRKSFFIDPMDPAVAEEVYQGLLEGKSLAEIMEVFEESEENQDIGKVFTAAPHEKIHIVPDARPERYFTGGMTGLGKSTVIADIASEYKKMFPEREIYLFCRTGGDEAFEGIDILEKVVNGDSDVDYEMEEFTQDGPAMVIFDDMDNLPDKKQKQKIHALMSDMMANGRKLGLTTCYMTHIIYNYSQTRGPINENNKFIFFNGGNRKHILRYLGDQVGLKPREAEFILQLDTRWTCISMLPPKYIITENQIMML